ncbi:MAG: tRNA (ms[2]io[6]A)-hydroxylase [Verrucomicrobia bacterium]|nr:tRNA (ms[2]io[6]A)-hydroxylase [Verrucomicrobiota bacterium]
MLLFRAKILDGWFEKIISDLPAVLIDHAHLERKAATTSLTLEKYRELFGKVHELNAIAMEELQHFELVLQILKRRGIPFGQPFPSPWIRGLMANMRPGARFQVIDHLIVCSLIEGRSCEKFQILAERLKPIDPELMAREINEKEADERLDFFLDLDAKLIREPNPLAMLH